MLELKNVTKSFGEKQIFKDFSHSFNTGIYIIKGTSGIGKTTLLRMISGLDTNFDGEISGGGIQNVSLSFQEYRLFEHLNAIENVTIIDDIASNEAKSEAALLLNSLGIYGKDQLLYPREMSGGMKLRVSIARALFKKAPILLLDEPTREFNIEHSKMLVEILKKRAQEQTILIVTHDSTIESLCTDAIVLNF